MFRHPETGQFLPVPSQEPIVFNTEINPFRFNNNQLDNINTNKPQPQPFTFQPACKGIISTPLTAFNPNPNPFKKEEVKQTEKEIMENEKNKLIQNMFTELIQMRTQIQTISTAVDRMFTIVSKLK